MKKAKTVKCWYSRRGLNQLRVEQREGLIVGESRDKRCFTVVWDRTKTRQKIAKSLISTDPLMVLYKGYTRAKKQDFQEGPIDIDKSTWYYLMKDHISVMRENRDEDNNYLGSRIIKVSFKELIKDLPLHTITDILEKYLTPSPKQ